MDFPENSPAFIIRISFHRIPETLILFQNINRLKTGRLAGQKQFGFNASFFYVFHLPILDSGDTTPPSLSLKIFQILTEQRRPPGVGQMADPD